MIFVVVPYRHGRTDAANTAVAYAGFTSIEDLRRALVKRRDSGKCVSKFVVSLAAIDRGDWVALSDDLQCVTLPKKV